MSRRAAGWTLAVALCLVVGGLAWWWQFGRGGGRAGRHAATAGATGPASTELHAFELYFPAGSGLRAERRELPVSDQPKDRIRKVLEALLAGPATATAPTPATAGAPTPPAAAGAKPAAPARGATPQAPPAPATAATAATAGGLVRPFPPEVKLGSVELSADGIAFVDLRWPDHEDPPESGSTEEIQRVYSVVDSLALNVPEVNRVVLLWNGTQRITFSGHLDTSRPLQPDRTLLAP
ncbi:MAG TPA: GerMN domain-containing protein [Thermoanaerobaculia bacterium]|nr:GerMN domain-containing protein [Thermoanaerobaculia bacterium]